MNIKITSEEELKEKFRKGMHILNNLRRATREWKEHLGCENRKRKEDWEAKADQFLNELQMTETGRKEDIKITKI